MAFAIDTIDGHAWLPNNKIYSYYQKSKVTLYWQLILQRKAFYRLYITSKMECYAVTGGGACR